MGDKIQSIPLVTGCIIAVMGTETVTGELDVVDVKFADLPPQPARWALMKPPSSGGDVDMTEAASSPKGGTKIAIVSGLSFSEKNSSYAMELNLLLEFILGEALDPAIQRDIAQISRLIIAGNSIAPDDSVEKADKKSHRKYRYDTTSYNPTPYQLLDDFLAEILPSIPVTILPGANDPANAAYPQQPMHPAMFPKARAFVAADSAAQPDSFDCVTNPWEGEVEGWRFLGTGGQNVDDVLRYVDSDDRLGMMEGMCRWRCVAPTAPDTLCKLRLHVPPFLAPATLLVNLILTCDYRELPLPRRRPVRAKHVPPSLLRRLPASLLDKGDRRARGPVCASRDDTVLCRYGRDCACRLGDA